MPVLFWVTCVISLLWGQGPFHMCRNFPVVHHWTVSKEVILYNYHLIIASVPSGQNDYFIWITKLWLTASMNKMTTSLTCDISLIPPKLHSHGIFPISNWSKRLELLAQLYPWMSFIVILQKMILYNFSLFMYNNFQKPM